MTDAMNLSQILGGEPVHPELQAEFDVLHNVMQGEQQTLVVALYEKRITPGECLDRFLTILKGSMRELKVLLGEDRFYRVFGEAGDHPEGMIDRKTFLDQFE